MIMYRACEMMIMIVCNDSGVGGGGESGSGGGDNKTVRMIN